MNPDVALSKPKSDPVLLWLAAAATVVGIAAVFDAGYSRSIAAGQGVFSGESVRQMFYALIALVLGLGAARVPFIAWKRMAYAIFGLSLASLVAVALFGASRNGSQRWLDLRLFDVQPSEFTKLAVILFLAAVFASRKPAQTPTRPARDFAETLDRWIARGVRAWPLAFIGATFWLIERQPDLGTAAVIVVVALAMMFLGGVSARSLLWLLAISVLAAVFFAIKEPYRVERLVNHARRWEPGVVQRVGYQPTHAEAAMARGGLLGVGLSQGEAKQLLPAATTDYVLATIAEETGWIGSVLVIGLLGAITWRLHWLASRCAGRFGGLVLGGMSAWIGVQTFTNVLMANGTVASIGIPLPFISAGGSSIIALWLGIGLCLSAVAERSEVKEVRYAAGDYRGRDRRPRLSRT